MTVNTKKITSGPYTGNGIADTFSYGFKVQDKTELTVYETDDAGVETVLTVDTDYTVNTVGNDSGGTITRIAGALPTNYEWYIRSNYDETQLTAFTSQGPFFPDLHENMADKLTFLIQQLLDKIGRTFSLSDSYSGPLPLTLEDPVSGYGLRWGSDLTTLEVFDIDATYVNVSGDTMISPLSGPSPVTPDNYIPLGYADGSYVNITGDTMLSPLAGPPSVLPNDYMPQFQVAEVVDDRIESLPGFDPNQIIDYGFVTSTVGDLFDYGSVT